MKIEAPDSHLHCFACGSSDKNASSLNLNFQQTSTGAVKTKLSLDDSYQGYEGVLHGGIISTLLDSAMTHRLFADQITAMTAELQVRFIRPIPINAEIELTANIETVRRGIYTLTSQISDQKCIYATAKAKFMRP